MKIIKLDENKNPYLPDREMMRCLKRQVKCVSEYPASDNSALHSEIGKVFNINAENVHFGNGTMEIFEKLVKVFGDVKYGFLIPTFWGVKYYLGLNNFDNFIEIEYSADESENFANLEKLASECDVIYLCNTNNPNLHYFEKDLLLNIAKAHPHCHFVIDETLLAYEDFYAKSTYLSCTAVSNLSVVLSPSKIFGVAGIRAGILFSNKAIIEKANKLHSPFVTTRLTQGFIIHQMKRFNSLDGIKKKIYNNYKLLEVRLDKKQIKRIDNRNSCFVNVVLDDAVDIEDLKQYLSSHNIIVRYSSELVFATEKFLRISAGTRRDYLTLIKYFNKYFENN